MKYRSRRQMNSTHRSRPRKQQKKWTKEEDKVMILMIEQRPSIWNFGSPEYRDLDTKKKCWIDVAESTNHSVVDAKNHWNTIKSRFNLERKKDLQCRSKQSGATFSSNYELYQPLQFLATVEGRPPGRTATHLVMKDETHDFEDSSSMVTTPSTSDHDDEARITKSSSTKRKRKPLSAPIPSPQRTALLSEIVDIFKSRQEVAPAKRWKTVFLDYISCELDRYEDHDAQRLKNQILTVCMDFQPEPCMVMESPYVE